VPRATAILVPLIALLSAGCGSMSRHADKAAASRARPAATARPLLASYGIGAITGRCSGTRARLTFSGDSATATETVVAAIGHRRVRALVDSERKPLVVSVPLRSHPPRPPGRWDFETPTVVWTISQSTEPATVRATARLRLTTRETTCVPTLARFSLRSRSHGR
jgi:hypothetical protein